MDFLTILTPSYNRGYILPKLYQSLVVQTDKDFEWLIVDDGSTDDTAEIVRNFISEGKISVRYIKKENGGKHTALNVGVQNITAKWTMIVDSDDALTENAVESIRRYSDKFDTYNTDKPLCGISFLRAFPDGNTNGKKPEKNEVISDFIQNRINSHDELADKAEVYLTDVLKKYPFPVYNDERFLQENIVWISIAFDYNMLFLNEAIYIGDYLSDGLTRNVMKNKLNNPIGMYKNAELLMRPEFTFKNRLKGAVLYNIYYKIAHKKMKNGLKLSANRLLCGITLFPSELIYLYYMKKYSQFLSDKRLGEN